MINPHAQHLHAAYHSSALRSHGLPRLRRHLAKRSARFGCFHGSGAHLAGSAQLYIDAGTWCAKRWMEMTKRPGNSADIYIYIYIVI